MLNAIAFLAMLEKLVCCSSYFPYLGMSNRVFATGHIKDPVPLVERGRASCHGGRFPTSFIQQVKQLHI